MANSEGACRPWESGGYNLVYQMSHFVITFLKNNITKEMKAIRGVQFGQERKGIT
jgi:hypothetical protein